MKFIRNLFAFGLGLLRRFSWCVRSLLLVLSICFIVFAVLFLSVRYYVLPNINDYKPYIETQISERLNAKVSIKHIEANWNGLTPRLTLQGLSFQNKQSLVTLNLNRVYASVAWQSALVGGLRLSLIEIDQPDILIERDKAGDFWVAGFLVPKPKPNVEKDLSFQNWLFSQPMISIHQGRIRWQDHLRAAPLLTFEGFNALLINRGHTHQFALVSNVKQGGKSMLDLNIKGNFTRPWFVDTGDVDKWEGDLFAQTLRTDFAKLKDYIDVPLSTSSGEGNARLWATVNKKTLTNLIADVRLNRLHAQFENDAPKIDVRFAQGRLQFKRVKQGDAYEHQIALNNFEMMLEDGTHLKPSNLTLRYNIPSAGPASSNVKPDQVTIQAPPMVSAKDIIPTQGSLTLDQADLTSLRVLLSYLRLPPQLQEKIQAMRPTGLFQQGIFSWKILPNKEPVYQGKMNFSGFGIQGGEASAKPEGHLNVGLPGFNNLKGVLEFNQGGGAFLAQGEQVNLQFPGVFEHPSIPFEQLNTKINWSKNNKGFQINVDEFVAKNVNGGVSFAGNYQNTGKGPGVLDLKGRLSYGDARAVWRYIPLNVPETARLWLRDNLVAGSSSNTSFEIKGDLSYFPFPESKNGLFRVTVLTDNTSLAFMKDWPVAEKIKAKLVFEGTSMNIDASSAKLLGVDLKDIHVSIPSFPNDPTLIVKARANGSFSDMLKFVHDSGIHEFTQGKLDGLKVTGQGTLDYNMRLPFKHVKDIQVEGNVSLQNSNVYYHPDLPELQQANGNVVFTQDGFAIKNVQGKFLGGNISLNAERQTDGFYRFMAQGTTHTPSLQALYPGKFWQYISGDTTYQAQVKIGQHFESIDIQSSLQGITLTLPTPFAKQANEPLNFHLTLKPGMFDNATNYHLEDWSLQAGSLFTTKFQRVRQPSGKMAITRGSFAMNTQANMPDQGFNLAFNLKSLDVDKWLNWFDAFNQKAADSKHPANINLVSLNPHHSLKTKEPPAVNAPEAKPDAFADVDLLKQIKQIDLTTGLLTVKGKKFRNLKIQATQQNKEWFANFKSEQAAGRVYWSDKKLGNVLKVDLAYLLIPADKKDEIIKNVAPEEDAKLESLPELDLKIGRFVLFGKELGTLKILAENDAGRAWNIKQFSLENADARLTGDGQWVSQPGNNSRKVSLKLNLEGNAGNLLERFDLGKGMKNGNAILDADVSWLGSPISIDYPSLSGNLTLNVKKGQFLVDIGAARLLSVLSLQALPRRLTLDFRDVFSEGFAFDEINATAYIKQGVMHTNEFKMTSTAANVVMSGSVDLAKETQQLKVIVYPDLTPDVATTAGVILVNPAAGVGTFLARLIFSKPLSKVFSREYEITGTWDDPQVKQKKKDGEVLEKNN